MAIGAGLVTKLVVSLLEGGAIDDILSKKLEDLGEDFIRQQLGAPLGILKGLEGGGQSGFENLRSQWLDNVTKLPNLPNQNFINKIFSVLDKTTGGRGGGSGAGGGGKHARAKWARSSWAQSRNDWLDNHWKHDWRSQPREPFTGRWVPGRLDYIEASRRSPGVKVGRRTKRRRKLRRQARMRGKKAAKLLMKGLRSR
jgi:hypothetical protein